MNWCEQAHLTLVHLQGIEWSQAAYKWTEAVYHMRDCREYQSQSV